MREYETVFILHPSTEEARVEEEIEGVRQTILNGSGEIVQVDRWGRRRMAYGIRKVNEGIYTLIRFRSEAGVLTDLERRYRLREEILRHLTVVAQGPAMTLEPPRREVEGVQPIQEGTPVAPLAVDAPPVAVEAVPSPGEPPMITAETPVATIEPPVATIEPPVATIEPPVATIEPPVATAEAPAVTTDPEPDSNLT